MVETDKFKFPEDGLITDDQRQTIASYLKRIAPDPLECTFCRSKSWNILDHFLSIPVFYPEDSQKAVARSYPSIGLICKTCSNTHFMNALVIFREEEKQGKINGGE